MDDGIYWIAIMNQMFLFQLTFVVLTFNYVVMISHPDSHLCQQEFSLQTVTFTKAKRNSAC